MKDAYYFSHDSNARNDQRLMKLRMKHGPEGYGIYFMLIEILRDTENYTLHLNDIDSICFDIRSENEKVLDVIKNYNLFEINDGFFHSKSLSRRLAKLDKIKEKRRESGKLGGKAKAKSYQTPSKSLANAKQVKESKVKESIVNNKKENIKEKQLSLSSKKNPKNMDFTFEHLYSLYPRKQNKDKSEKAFNRLTKKELVIFKEGVYKHIKYWKDNSVDKQYIPLLSTYINGKRWNDEILISSSDQPKYKDGLDEEIAQRNKNIAQQSQGFRQYMDNATENAADFADVRQILGKTMSKIKGKIIEEK